MNNCIDNQFRNLLSPEMLSRNRPKCQTDRESIITGERTTACQEFQEGIQMPTPTEISKGNYYIKISVVLVNYNYN